MDLLFENKNYSCFEIDYQDNMNRQNLKRQDQKLDRIGRITQSGLDRLRSTQTTSD